MIDTVSSSLSRVLKVTMYGKSGGKTADTDTTTLCICIYGNGLFYEQSGDIYHYHHYNHLGSTTKLADVKGEVEVTFTYGTYGELLGGSTSLTSFLFNGRCGVTTDKNGLYYMRRRYYSPELKRFVNQDGLTGSMGNGQSLNRYSYVQGNPVSYTDPFGLLPLSGTFTGTTFWHTVLGLLGCVFGVIGVVANLTEGALCAFVDHNYRMASLSLIGAITMGAGGVVKIVSIFFRKNNFSRLVVSKGTRKNLGTRYFIY